MSRITLPDGRWFNQDSATEYPEDTYWDGRNHISVSTGSQWDHETLYRTAGGRWVLESSSDYQSVTTTREIIGDERAARWLSVNNYDLSEIKDIPSEVDQALEIK